MANIGASHQHPRTHQDEDRKSYVIARMMLQCESNKHTPREKVSQGHRSMKQKRRQALLSHSCNSSWFNKQHTTDFGTPYSCKMLLNSCDNIVSLPTVASHRVMKLHYKNTNPDIFPALQKDIKLVESLN